MQSYRKHVTPQEQKTIIHLYTKKEMTIREITELFENYSSHIIRRVLLCAKIPLRKKAPRTGRWRHPAWKRQDEIIHLYTKDKLSQRAIAAKMGTSIITIRGILEANNVEFRSYREARRLRTDKYRCKETEEKLFHEQLANGREATVGTGTKTETEINNEFPVDLFFNVPDYEPYFHNIEDPALKEREAVAELVDAFLKYKKSTAYKGESFDECISEFTNDANKSIINAARKRIRKINT